MAASLTPETVILANAAPGEIRVALVIDNELIDYALWRPGSTDGFGDVHLARVIARVPAMAGCFLALAGGEEGFLPDSAGGRRASAGQVMAVEVTRAAHGGKGKRLAAWGGPVPPDGKAGLILRGADPLRVMAERFPQARIAVDHPSLMRLLPAGLSERVSQVTQAFPPEIEERVMALAEPSIVLKGGAILHIEPTSALTAIDVDAGAATAARRDKRAMQTELNHMIMPALARQIRLRNLAGAIVVDFAGLPVRARAALAPALTEALAADPLQPRLLGFTGLGFAEIIRPRQRPPLHELLATPLAAGLAALREAATQPTKALRLRAAPGVVAALETDAVGLADLAHRCVYPLDLRSDPSLQERQWRLEEVSHGGLIRRDG